MKNKPKKKKETFKDYFLAFVESIRHRFASFDTLVQLTPISVINLFRWLVCYVFIFAFYRYTNGITDVDFFAGSTLIAKLLKSFFHIKINLAPGINALFGSILLTIWARIFYRIGKYFENMWAAVYLFIVENARIKKIPLHKKILYVFTWPTFDIIGRYTTYIALFTKVTWKPIPHNSKITITDIEGTKDE